MENLERIKGITFVITASMLWGISGTVAQFLFQIEGISPDWLVDIRLLASGLILLIYASIKGNRDLWKIWKSRHNCFSLIAFSIIGMLGVQYTYFATIKYGNAATATILQYLSPVIITCYLTIVSKKAPDLKEIIAVGLAMLGTFFIITNGNIHSIAVSSLTLFWGIISAFAAAFYTLQPRSLLSRWSSTIVAGWGMFIGGLAFSIYKQPWNFHGEFSAASVSSVVFIIFLGTIIAFNFYLESLKYINATEVSILSSVEPLSAAFLSVIWLHIPFSIADGFGTLCIISTIAILSYKNKK